MADKSRLAQQAPFLDLRIGGLHVTVQTVPYRLLALIATVAGSVGGATWLGR
ncbi:hypothetical protein [Streptomyces sp. RK75]|uniref:hypothetical protein n=1 Tax=Streptomyces sp. RK75 TaxID=2824895 RepID=UPI001B38B238|nr:hypothetical protein [Streptomyces sp. RK75]MBQ0867351.1 hypothetical protein [Streptomyces sp. RK75]